MGQITSRDLAERAVNLAPVAPFQTPWLSPDARQLYDTLYKLTSFHLNTTDPDTVAEYVNHMTDNRFMTDVAVDDLDTEVERYKHSLQTQLYTTLMLNVKPEVLDPHLLRIARTLGSAVETQVAALMAPLPPAHGAVRVPMIPPQYKPVPVTRGLSGEAAYVLVMDLINRTQGAGICNTLATKFYDPIKHTYIDGGTSQTSNANAIVVAPDDLRKVRACTRARSTLVVPLVFYYDNKAHYNLLFIDFQAQTAEHYEPHGHQYAGEDNLALLAIINDAIDAFCRRFVAALSPSLRYVPRVSICPSVGPQTLETEFSGGYCTVWNLYLFHLRLLNPTLPLSVLVDTTLAYPNILYELTRYRCQMLNTLRGLPTGAYPPHVRAKVRRTLEKHRNYMYICSS